MRKPRFRALLLAALTGLVAQPLMSQTNLTDAARRLAKAELPPPFSAPQSEGDWNLKRKQIRAQLWELLGKLPPRPKVPQVQLVSREERPEYIVEKFQFDNLAGAIVPGYLIIPKRLAGGPCPGWMII